MLYAIRYILYAFQYNYEYLTIYVNYLRLFKLNYTPYFDSL